MVCALKKRIFTSSFSAWPLPPPTKISEISQALVHRMVNDILFYHVNFVFGGVSTY